LRGVIIQTGKAIHGGHYIYVNINEDGSKTVLDDQTVGQRANIDDLIQRNGYICYYKKIQIDATRTSEIQTRYNEIQTRYAEIKEYLKRKSIESLNPISIKKQAIFDIIKGLKDTIIKNNNNLEHIYTDVLTKRGLDRTKIKINTYPLFFLHSLMTLIHIYLSKKKI
jgi:hypothetical protein